MTIRDAGADLPSIIGFKVHFWGTCIAQIHADVVLKGVFGDLCSVQVNFEGLL